MYKTNIYLDIDGVLLANNLKPAKHSNEFLRYVLNNYANSTYWLTTHCQGDPSVPILHVARLFEPDVQELMKLIKPTSWDMAKTRAIDMTEPFLWFDDNLFYEEKVTLTEAGLLDNWIEVDLKKDENQLLRFVTSFPIPVVS